MKTLLQTALLLVLITACAMGQAARTATLLGTVTDPTGAIIQAAQVTVKNVETAFVSKERPTLKVRITFPSSLSARMS